MGIVVGIDIGGSTTKIAGFQGKDMLIPVQISANNAIASLFGAFGKFLYDNKLALEDIQQVNLTGVGCSAVDQAIYGLPTYRVDECTATGVGGGYFAQGKKECMVVSMGLKYLDISMSSTLITDTCSGTFMPVSRRYLMQPIAVASLAQNTAENPAARSHSCRAP